MSVLVCMAASVAAADAIGHCALLPLLLLLLPEEEEEECTPGMGHLPPVGLLDLL
jgi:hypothetical protein